MNRWHLCRLVAISVRSVAAPRAILHVPTFALRAGGDGHAPRGLVAAALVGLVLLLGALLAPEAAWAATKTWTGAGNDGNWTTGANWGGTAPSADDDLVFPSGPTRLTTNNDFAPGTSFNVVTISGTGYVLGGNSIALNSSMTSSVASGEIDTVSLDIDLPFIEPISVSNSGAVLVLSGALSGNGSPQKTGAGTLRFLGSSANTYNSTPSVITGTLQLGKTAGVNAIPGTVAVGTDASAATLSLLADDQIADTAQVRVFSGGTFNLNGHSDTIGALELRTNDTTAAQVTTGAGTLTLGGNVTLTVVGTGATGATISGHLGLGSATRTFNVAHGSAAADLDVSAVIGGTGGVSKTGAGFLQYSGTAANAYSGLTIVSAGALTLAKTAGVTALAGDVTTSNAILSLSSSNQIADTAAVTVNGTGGFGMNGFSETIGSLAGSSNMALGAGALTVGANNTSTTFSGLLDGTASASFTKIGAGTLELSGANTYRGTTTVSGGTLLVSNASGLGDTATGTTVNSGAALAFGGGITVAEPLTLNGTGIGGTGALLGLALNTGDDDTWSGPITLASDTSIGARPGAGTLLTISGVVSGPGALIKTGTGPMVLSGGSANTYTGTTTVGQGDLLLHKAGALGTSGSGQGTTVQAGGTLSLAGGITVTEPLTLNGAGTTTSIGALANADSQVNTVDAPIALASDSSVGAAAGKLALTGLISGPHALTKVGPGTVQLTGSTSNTYTGTTTVNAGTLELAKSAFNGAIAGPLVIGDGVGTTATGVVRLLASHQIADSAGVTVTSSGLLDIGSTADDIGSLTGSGQVLLSTGDLLGIGANNTSTVFSGLISGDGGRVNKNGSGTLTFTNDNTYTGRTEVFSGTLVVNGSQPGSRIVLGGGTLAGTGTVGPIIPQLGGKVSPGSSPGILNSGSVSLNAASTLVAELNGTTPGTQYDQLNVTGTVDVGGAALNATIGFAANPGTSFTIIQNDGSDPVQGTFAGLPEGSTLAIGGQGFQITYKGGDGNDVVLTRVAPCTVRPNVRLPVQPTADGRLQVTVFAGADPATTGLVQQLQFTRLANAVIEDANHNALPNTVLVNPPQTSFQFFVRRAAAGQASTADLTVTDTCGTWPTFVGGGASAF
jgi:fibronectin-binding autotransporter adhesin